MMKVATAIVGCGNVAAFYCNAIRQHPILEFAGVADRNPERSELYAAYYSTRKYDTLEDVLNDSKVEMIINLTNPRSHFNVSKAALEAGKHVYSEKPLGMSFQEAQELVGLAEKKGLVIASAPSRILAETAQTIWKALRENAIGKVHAAYAEMDGGLICRTRYKEWTNELGIHWPYYDEFAVGCTIEHAGYPVSWLSAFFGPVDTVTACATRQVLEPGCEIDSEVWPPDLTVACLKFKSGVLARLTSSWIAPSDHSMRLFGDTGILSTDDIWQPRSPVRITRSKSINLGPKTITVPWKTKYPLAKSPEPTRSIGNFLRSPGSLLKSLRCRLHHLRKRVDFCIGPAEVATSIREGRPCKLSPEYCLHNTEIVLAIHNSLASGTHYKVVTTFDPMEPMSWALSRSTNEIRANHFSKKRRILHPQNA
ncbi:MAG TPA: Gfo/Idh/MocA family oxidoreductase [Verrucomicrobiae bacterium]|nr:Gfo/Idh/MocA family oxidoreductase [Verrucomicrobiae bacterium]